MSEFEVLIPKLGESIQEATITKIFVKVGDSVQEDDLLFEVATDKVDSEIPSPVAGIIKSISCQVDDLLAVGKVAMVIDLGGTSSKLTIGVEKSVTENPVSVSENLEKAVKESKPKVETTRFFSPLVKNIARKEGIQLEELEEVEGSGIGGRIQKNDLMKYLEERNSASSEASSQKLA